MRHFILYALLFFICVAQACKKIDVEPTEGNPVFIADFVVDNSAVELVGGIDDYYMFTSFEKDMNSIYSFIGKIQLENCDSLCGESLEIRIRDIEQRPTGNPDINEALALGEYNFRSMPLELGTTITEYDTTETAVVELINTSFGGNPASTAFSWFTSDGDTLPGPQALLVLNAIDPLPTVTLRMREDLTGSDFCESTSTQQINISNQSTCSVSISPGVIDSTLNQLTAVPEGTIGNVTFNWGNSLDSILVGNLLPGEYAVTISDDSGCVASASYSYGNNPTNCQARFNYSAQTFTEVDSTEIQLPGDMFQFSRVTVIYNSPDNIEYRSDEFNQPGNSNFQLLGTEDFDDNENGFPTKKLRLRFNCQLWNNFGEPINIETTSDAFFGVAYPN